MSEKELQTQEEAHEEVEKKSAKKESERQDITTLHERTIATLSYISFLAVIPFYLKKDSEFCRFHGKQGLLLSIIFFIGSLFTAIDLLFDLFLIIQILTFFLMGFAALSGRWKKLPFIYDWACQLEKALDLRSKEDESEAGKFMPNETDKPKEDVASSQETSEE